MAKQRADYEARFHFALKTILSYMTTAQLRRESEKRYGLEYGEALEMAYENVRGEAEVALKGYRKPKSKGRELIQTTHDESHGRGTADHAAE